MIFRNFPHWGMRHLHNLSILHENQHTQGRKITENHAKNENFHPESSLVNIELGDAQDNNLS